MSTNKDSAASRNRNVETHLKNLNGCFHEETFTIQNPKQATKRPRITRNKIPYQPLRVEQTSDPKSLIPFKILLYCNTKRYSICKLL